MRPVRLAIGFAATPQESACAHDRPIAYVERCMNVERLDSLCAERAQPPSDDAQEG